MRPIVRVHNVKRLEECEQQEDDGRKEGEARPRTAETFADEVSPPFAANAIIIWLAILIQPLNCVLQVAMLEIVYDLSTQIVQEIRHPRVAPQNVIDDPFIVENLNVPGAIDQTVPEHEVIRKEGLGPLVALFVGNEIQK